MSTTGRVQVLCVFGFFFCQPGVLWPIDRVLTIQGERQLLSWPWTNSEENQDTLLSLVMAPARVEVAAFPDGSHLVFPPWLWSPFSLVYKGGQLQHTSPGDVQLSLMHAASLQLCLTRSFACPDLCSSIYPAPCSSKGCAALLESWGDSLNAINGSHWP